MLDGAPPPAPEPAAAAKGIVPNIRLVIPEDNGPIEIRIGDAADDKPKRVKRRSTSADFGRNLALDMDDQALLALAKIASRQHAAVLEEEARRLL